MIILLWLDIISNDLFIEDNYLLSLTAFFFMAASILQSALLHNCLCHFHPFILQSVTLATTRCRNTVGHQ